MYRIIIIAVMLSILSSCGGKQEITELKHYPISNLEGVIDRQDATFDVETSHDGNGSLQFDVPESTIVHLYETGPIDADNCTLIYEAQIRTEAFFGEVYLEMWCAFTGKGEYFSRNLNTPVTTATNWVTRETYFYLQKDQKPNNVKLNLIINGTGTVWIDDIKLLRGPLKGKK
jgi:hypothetical protein